MLESPAVKCPAGGSLCVSLVLASQPTRHVHAGGENEYIWQAWATLEAKQGHIAMARKLYDAAIVANSKHAAAWHGWGLLERRQSNYSKACSLWLKVGCTGACFCVA